MTEAERADKLDKLMNLNILKQAKTCDDPIMGRALFARFAECEIVRLNAKEAAMKNGTWTS